MFMKAIQDLMGTLPMRSLCVAPPMASVKARPRRKWVVVSLWRPLLSVICGKPVGNVVGARIVEGHGDDPVVGKPLVFHGFHVALPVQFDTEGLFGSFMDRTTQSLLWSRWTFLVSRRPEA